MVYGSWDRKLYLSFSDDGITWETPAIVFDSEGEGWYPNLVSEESDLFGGKRLRLYYSYNIGTYGIRDMKYRTLTFESEYIPSKVDEGAGSIKGDVNGDGTVNVSDVTSVINIILGK